MCWAINLIRNYINKCGIYRWNIPLTSRSEINITKSSALNTDVNKDMARVTSAARKHTSPSNKNANAILSKTNIPTYKKNKLNIVIKYILLC